ncbi:MAG TPA: non-homologous end-joining DNA ligase [Methylomirabilota bacterium]|nr:non-homologous end-joining DNA ligase [Methylomirabilota bacterium]
MSTARVADVTITNADKVWWSDEGITKGEVAGYYARVATRLLPFTVNRPLTVERCPDGFRGRCFYQKNFAVAERLGIPTVAIRATSVNRLVHYPLGNDVATLLALVNLGGLSLHLTSCRAGSLDVADWLAFDLDPAARFADAVQAAGVLREVLDDAGLRSYVKTTGGKGLHVLVPLRPRTPHADVLAYAGLLAERVIAKAPDLTTSSFAKSGRGGRVYLDLARNVCGATLVAPYSVRHRPHAPVSTPLSWDELRADLDPARLNVRSVLERLAAEDPWREFWSDRQKLPSPRRASAANRAVGRKRRSVA